MNNESKHYLKNVRLLFPIYGKQERRFLDDLKDDIDDYFEKKQEATLSDITNKFGEPSDIVANYIDGLEAEDLYKRISSSTILKRIGIIILILVFTIAAFVGALAYKDYQTAQEQHVVKETIVIEE